VYDEGVSTKPAKTIKRKQERIGTGWHDRLAEEILIPH
jgi:hypothetical protein